MLCRTSTAAAAAFALVLAPSVATATGGGDATAAESSGLLPSVLWMAPVYAGGGYSSEAISYILGLEKAYKDEKKEGLSGRRHAFRQFAEEASPDFVKGLPRKTAEVLQRLEEGRSGRQSNWDVVVCHATPDVWHPDGAFGWGSIEPCPPPEALYRVGRTMYETDRLPETWVPRINEMDEVWVPSDFAVEQFVSSGVKREKIVVVPEAVDTDFFNPEKHKPLDLEGGKFKFSEPLRPNDFKILSVFKWELRKGWDLLLQAYFSTFSANDPVMLIIKTTKFHSREKIEKVIKDFSRHIPSMYSPMARYVVITKEMPLWKLPQLYRAADLFVLPSRGEGWGRPHVEAMAMGLPVIATNWGGSTGFLSENNSLPLTSEGLEAPGEKDPLGFVTGVLPGHKWAKPSKWEMGDLMRWAFEHREEARALGARARADMVARFKPGVVIRKHVLPQLRRIAGKIAARRRVPDEL